MAAKESFNKQIINVVEEVINHIGVIDTQSGDNIANARLELDTLTRKQQKMILI